MTLTPWQTAQHLHLYGQIIKCAYNVPTSGCWKVAGRGTQCDTRQTSPQTPTKFVGLRPWITVLMQQTTFLWIVSFCLFIFFVPPPTPFAEIEPRKFYNKIFNALNTADETQIRWATPKTCKLNKMERWILSFSPLLVPIADKFVLINNDTMGIKLRHVENDGKWMQSPTDIEALWVKEKDICWNQTFHPQYFQNLLTLFRLRGVFVMSQY